MTFISYVNFLPSLVTLVTEFLLSLLLLTLMMLAMVEAVTSGKAVEPLVAMNLAEKNMDASRITIGPVQHQYWCWYRIYCTLLVLCCFPGQVVGLNSVYTNAVVRPAH